MDRRFLHYYEQELRFVRDLAGEFASQHARVANRFGLEKDSCADPHVEWLLDGFAFLAARVQLKYDGEYERFTQALLEMVAPGFATPLPAAGIVRFEPEPNPALLEAGVTIPRGTELRSFSAGETRCTFTTAQPVTLWPIRVAALRYVTGGGLAALGLPGGVAGRAALVLKLAMVEDVPFHALALDRLNLHLAGHDPLAHRLFETLTARVRWLVARPGSERAAAVVLPGSTAVDRLGFDDDEALLPTSKRTFSGYRLMQEYFLLPERFLFVELGGLLPAVRACTGRELEIVLVLDAPDPLLDGAVAPDAIELFATPVINLFRKLAKPIVMEAYEREHHVVADRVRPLDFEVIDVLDVEGIGTDERDRLDFTPFYDVPHLGDIAGRGAYYALERRPRLVSASEKRRYGGARSAYLGSELFLTLSDGKGAPWPARLTRLDVTALCSNRDLPIRLPLPADGSHFTTELGAPIAAIRLVGRISEPRDALALTDDPEAGPHGVVAWRLIGLLSLNYLSLLDTGEGDGAEAIRALLSLLAARADRGIARHVEGVRRLSSRRVTDRLPGPGPITFGRGLEVSLELAESAFQEGSAFLLGSVLENFFRRWVSLNSFVGTIVRTSERGELIRWPARIGSRHLM